MAVLHCSAALLTAHRHTVGPQPAAILQVTTRRSHTASLLIVSQSRPLSLHHLQSLSLQSAQATLLARPSPLLCFPQQSSVAMRVLSVLLLVLCATLTFASRHTNRVLSEPAAAIIAAAAEAAAEEIELDDTPAPSAPAATAYIWPQPKQFTMGSDTYYLSYPLTVMTSPSFPDMDAAIMRFKDTTFQHRAMGDTGVQAITTVLVRVKDINAPLQLSTDESYSLSIAGTDEAITINANTYYGALHALETLSQLITFDFAMSVYQIGNSPWQIDDSPRYPHRGVLVDTSRHYQTLPVIRKIIDSLTYSKFNVFHWHLSDIQSFPYQSDVLPMLSQAAYSINDRYSTGDVADVVEYARQRGVRVMMEFDIPGHAGSWCVGYPEVCPSPSCNMPLDPSSNETFSLMEQLFVEITGGSSRKGLVPEDLLHLGGDEVDLSCWTQVDHVKQWLADNNMTDRDAYRYMVERAHDYIYKFGRTPINWDEVWANFGKTIDPQTIIHVWRNEEYVYNATRDGFRVLVSPDGPWYLDGLGTSWEDMYLLEPEKGITDPAQTSLILGGEGCMWGETVDASVIVSTIWPRAAAIGERLWSPKTVADTTAADGRYRYFRCLLNRRGIAAGPANASTARQAPDGPGSCLDQ